MSISRIAGQMLQANLYRDGNNLSFSNTSTSGSLLYIDVGNSFVGVNTGTPTDTLAVNGNTVANNYNFNLGNAGLLTLDASNHGFTANVNNYGLVGLGLTDSTGAVLYGNTLVQITANTNDGLNEVSWNFYANALLNAPGNITANGSVLSNVSFLTGNIVIPASGNINAGYNYIGNVINPVQAQDAATKYYVDQATSSASGNVIGNLIPMGTPSQGNLVSNAVTLTANTTVTDGIAELNVVLGKLVPPAPSNFPAGQTLSLNSLSSYRMANGVAQTNNTTTGNKSVNAGTTVSSVLRSGSFSTNTIVTAGPGDSGTVTIYIDSVASGNVTFNASATPSGNGTHGNLIITNNYDYHQANSSITAGFWYVFSAQGSGSGISPGWNELYIGDSVTANTNTPTWYYDNSSPGTPQFTNTSISAPGSPSLTYSSTIPHYVNTNSFTIAANVNRISGNMYPTSDTFVTGSAGGAFGTPGSLTYSSANVATPVAQNLYANSGSLAISTTSSIVSGFGSSASGPGLSVNNSYATGTNTFTPSGTVLYKTGNTTAIDEGNVVIGSTIGSGSGNAFRIVNPGTGNTPTYTGSEAAFNSQSGPLQTYDAVVVGSGSGGVLAWNNTNYSTGYLPAGPNLSAGRSGTQYFTMKFVRTSVSKFDIAFTGTVAGVWVALPGSVIDSSSSANGWINMNQAYGGAGYPGVNSPGNGSDGCSLGGIITLNQSGTQRKTCTFGTVSSSSTGTNEIYVRIALTSGQSVTALTLQSASN